MKINCIGLACPLPVIRTKQYLREHAGESVEVLVDNEVATQNLSKMAQQLGMQATVTKQDDHRYTVVIDGTMQSEECAVMEMGNEYVVAISADKMGDGAEELSKKLIEGFIYSLTEQDVLPKFVVCYNAGVKLSSINPKTVEDLKTLVNKGVQVLSCGLCLDFYGLKENLQAGEITNMYRIVEILRSHRVVRP
ncbi:MAG: sulfurtransferase-like selenium metabolism protein YedF [Eubacteriales bacterium]|nr:sulfurtransferase-like selenium metabolism protein YedF [Eubacteriales bacterium]